MNTIEITLNGIIVNAISKGTNFDIIIDKQEAERLVKDGVFVVMCKEYGDDEDWVELCTDDLDENGNLDEDYKTFEIWLDQRFDYDNELLKLN